MHLAMRGTETVAYLLIANACDPGDNQILKPSPPFPSSTCTERERRAVSKYRDQHVPIRSPCLSRAGAASHRCSVSPLRILSLFLPLSPWHPRLSSLKKSGSMADKRPGVFEDDEKEPNPSECTVKSRKRGPRKRMLDRVLGFAVQ